MSKRVQCIAAIVAALLLGSCDNMPTSFTKADAERLDYAEINIRRGAAASSDMVDRVERGEARIEELERKLRDLERLAAEAADTHNRNSRMLEDRWQAYLRHTH